MPSELRDGHKRLLEAVYEEKVDAAEVDFRIRRTSELAMLKSIIAHNDLP